MNVLMPQLGETVAEGTLSIWHKNVGERVEANELLFEISTDKVEMEVPAPAGGVMKEILVKEGETVEVGAILSILYDANDGLIETTAPEPAPAIENNAQHLTHSPPEVSTTVVHPLHSHPLHSHLLHSHPLHSHPMHSRPLHSRPQRRRQPFSIRGPFEGILGDI